MSKPGPGYAEGYLALFSHEVEEEAVAAAEAGDREAQATLQTAAEHAAMDLAEEKRRIFLLGWQNGLKASWEQLKEANRHASELNLEGCQGRFTHGSSNFLVKPTYILRNPLKHMF